MARKTIPLFDLKLSARTIRETTATLRSGWLTSGPKVRAFEETIAGCCGVRYAAAVNSGTAGLVTALVACGVSKGSEVITTPLTFVATVEAILLCGAKPALCDIDPETLTIDPDTVEKSITSRTSAIVTVDLAGHPCDYDRLGRVARAHKVPIIADATHALGASWRGKSMARLADAAVYSFYSTKNLTCGEGGMVVSHKKQVIDRVRLLALHGMTSGAFQRKRVAGSSYDVLALGHKANMSDVHASIGLGQWASFERDQRKRARLAERYEKRLAGLDDYVQVLKVDRRAVHARHLFIVLLNTDHIGVSRDRVIGRMARQGVECGVHYRPVFDLTWYREQGLTGRRLPVASAAGERVLTLPLYPLLKLADVDYVSKALAAAVGATSSDR